jgi:hypothetical protein
VLVQLQAIVLVQLQALVAVLGLVLVPPQQDAPGREQGPATQQERVWQERVWQARSRG